VSTLLTALAVWLVAALVIGGLWALRGGYRHHRELEHERAVVEWRHLLRVLARRDDRGVEFWRESRLWRARVLEFPAKTRGTDPSQLQSVP
jgi:hypothetical protein